MQDRKEALLLMRTSRQNSCDWQSYKTHRKIGRHAGCCGAQRERRRSVSGFSCIFSASLIVHILYIRFSYSDSFCVRCMEMTWVSAMNTCFTYSNFEGITARLLLERLVELFLNRPYSGPLSLSLSALHTESRAPKNEREAEKGRSLNSWTDLDPCRLNMFRPFISCSKRRLRRIPM